jgi:hypothetical protein
MPLTSRDLEQIRRIVREEIERANRHAPPEHTAIANEPAQETAVAQDVRAFLERARREAAEREARPIPNTAFVDRYDAARLLGVTMDTITTYTKRGLLTRHMVKGKIQVSRSEIDTLLARGPRRSRRRFRPPPP